MDAARVLTRLGTLTARPGGFLVLLAYLLLSLIFDRRSLDWHGAESLATWAITLLIQRAEHRDTQAIQAKLDELIHADRGAKDELNHIDRQEPGEIERRRDAD